MVVIRLQRRGTKKTPHHRIVAVDQRRAQGSRILEVLGHYNPSGTPPSFTIKESRLVHWVSSGAKVTEALQRLLETFAKVSLPK